MKQTKSNVNTLFLPLYLTVLLALLNFHRSSYCDTVILGSSTK